MRIYLVRHAESIWQCEPSDDFDTELSEVGRDQADHLARWLGAGSAVDYRSRVEIAHLAASPLKRAQQTAAATAQALSLPAAVLPSLREASFHVADHLPASTSPLLPAGAVRTSPAYAALRLQAREALDELVATVSDAHGPALAVAHGGLIKTMLRLMAGSDGLCFRLYNTGLTLVEWRRGRWHIVFVNLLDHLPPALRTL